MWRKWVKELVKLNPLNMKNLFKTDTPSQSDKVIRLFAMGKGLTIVRAIHDEKLKSSTGSPDGEGKSEGITVKRIGAVKAG